MSNQNKEQSQPTRREKDCERQIDKMAAKKTGKKMDYKTYKFNGEIEVRSYVEGENLKWVTVGKHDTPQKGGMIARDPADPDDVWYITRKYFKQNFIKKKAKKPGTEVNVKLRFNSDKVEVNIEMEGRNTTTASQEYGGKFESGYEFIFELVKKSMFEMVKKESVQRLEKEFKTEKYGSKKNS